ncbi:simple sugar transport system permease protein [Keratinibaculum paraultunense]|uniref:Simple sugar transport system permease protein n=2 Tax=Keratinibaculum paraultunense TaxID=1278232 RepID=A0A4R3KY84_9FIRM|nr:simple sugar transport system permease protein [Keratinibaculum paraultunense]
MKALNDLGIILGISLMYAAPLMYTALGGVISENAGVVNIGLEGMMTIGAFTGAAVSYFTGNPWLGFLAAGLSGGALALLHAVACVTFAADHVISGTAINFIGPGLALYLCKIFFDGAAMTLPLDLNHKIPRPLDRFFSTNSFWNSVLNQYATVYIAFLLVILVWFILYKTKLGLRLRSVGEHPRAADTLGIDVFKIKYLAVILSGILAGFGGAALSIAVVSNYRISLISGQGFIALAAMIFGNWKPQGAMWGCLLFGIAQGLAVYLGGTSLKISSQILAMIPYIITIIVLVFFVGEATGPAANGIPYEKDQD